MCLECERCFRVALLAAFPDTSSKSTAGTAARWWLWWLPQAFLLTKAVAWRPSKPADVSAPSSMHTVQAGQGAHRLPVCICTTTRTHAHTHARIPGSTAAGAPPRPQSTRHVLAGPAHSRPHTCPYPGYGPPAMLAIREGLTIDFATPGRVAGSSTSCSVSSLLKA